MLILTGKQLRKFSRLEFEAGMSLHVAEYFPDRYLMMGAHTTGVFVHSVLRDGEEHGCFTKKDLCHYLNCAIVLGHAFHSDPRFPWVQEVLNDPGEAEKPDRMSCLGARLLEYDKVVPSTLDKGPFRHLVGLEAGPVQDKPTAILPTKTDVAGFYAANFADLVRIFGPAAIDAVAAFAIERADQLRLTSRTDVLLFASCMLIAGIGFDRDPQFPWIREALERPVASGQDQRVAQMVRETVLRLRTSVVPEMDIEP